MTPPPPEQAALLVVCPAAEPVVGEHRERLPFTQVIDHLELWSGPPPEVAGERRWRHVRDFRLGPAAV